MNCEDEFESDEMILYRPSKELFDIPLDKVMEGLTEIWDREWDSSWVDLEKLFGTGQIARLRGVILGPRLKEWIAARYCSLSLDIASCVLMGYWSGSAPVDGELVELLLQAMNPRILEGDSLHTTICALGYAWGHIRNSDLERADSIKKALEPMWEMRQTFSSQPLVLQALRAVLGKTND